MSGFDQRDGLIWFNGEMIPWTDAQVHLLTHALHYGSAVFEGMRAVLFDGVFRWDLLAGAMTLNIVYLGIGAALFLWSFQVARRHGLLLQTGE